jgi:drug/metabolite transporter (DMT)-like permease
VDSDVAVTHRRIEGRKIVSGFLYALLATFLWSIVPVGIKYLLHQSMNPFTIAFSRFVLASGVLFLIARVRGQLVPLTRADLPLFLLGGLGMAGNYTLYAVGLRHTTASATNIIVQDEVIALVILSHFILGERIGWAKVLGMLAAMTGIVVVFRNGQTLDALLGSKQLMGNIIIFFAGLSWPMYGIVQKFLSRRRVSNTSGLAYIFAISAVIAAIPAAIGPNAQTNLNLQALLWLFIVGVISTGMGYLCLARAFSCLPASTVAVITCMLPIFTLLMAGLFLGETLTRSIALGALLVVAGIALIGREEAMSRPSAGDG